MPKKHTDKPSLEERVSGFIEEHRLTSRRHVLLVAVSGGQDSVCLLHILHSLQSSLGIKLHVAHLDHQLRGAESEADARYVAGLAKSLGVPATIGRRDVRLYQKEHGISLEEAAREVRYGFLTEVAASIGADRVAVGHTLDDHVETILLHLVRGSGTRGLRGLQPIIRWQSSGGTLTVVRPLLKVRREETAEYCINHQLQPCMDATNLSLIPLRNRVRLELLPLLKSYNPQVITALLRTAYLAGDDIDYLEKEAHRLWRRVASQQGGTIILDKEAFLKWSSSMQRYLLRIALEKLVGNLRDIEARHIEELMEALTKPSGKQISLPYGLVFTVDYSRYLLGKDPTALSPFPVLDGEYLIKIPGKTIIPGWYIQAKIIKVGEAGSADDNFTAHFDYAGVSGQLVVRPRKRGDRFQPLGMKETKKLGEFMLDARIPRDWRACLPIVCSGEKVLWVMGYRIDERVKVTEETERVLRLKFERI
ncbi:MAG: tRNA lysidine(34) synthetase TilS [Dehalococcoidales bacterium]|nr:tRNA lysidine(34) synthetase TilS [Dehalococcoidales bacterium]